MASNRLHGGCGVPPLRFAPPVPSPVSPVSPRPADPTLVLRDPLMIDICDRAERVAAGNISVLILGETGVGKERFAEIIHRASGRKNQPFISVNCAAINPNLFESELFGFERGAFTGADRNKPGWFELAGAGTLFLDEVTELPLESQAKLLRAIETRTAARVGGLEVRPIQARFVAATNRDPNTALDSGLFRKDLYYRIAGATFTLPPLRERPSEVMPLAESFALAAGGSHRFSPAARAALLAHPFPGNIRELRNVVERAVLLARGPVIGVRDLELGPAARSVHPAATAAPAAPLPPGEADEAWRERITAALLEAGGNQTRAAAALDIGRMTLSRWLDRLGIPRPRKQRVEVPPPREHARPLNDDNDKDAGQPETSLSRGIA